MKNIRSILVEAWWSQRKLVTHLTQTRARKSVHRDVICLQLSTPFDCASAPQPSPLPPHRQQGSNQTFLASVPQPTIPRAHIFPSAFFEPVQNAKDSFRGYRGWEGKHGREYGYPGQAEPEIVLKARGWKIRWSRRGPSLWISRSLNFSRNFSDLIGEP